MVEEAPPAPLELSPGHWIIVRDILRSDVPGFDVWAFGSRVKGTARAHSDLDLVIIGDRPLELSLIAKLTDAFAESDLPFRVDVVDWATTGESFREIIYRDKVTVQTARE